MLTEFVMNWLFPVSRTGFFNGFRDKHMLTKLNRIFKSQFRSLSVLSSETLPHVSVTQIKNVLKSLNASYEDGFTSLQTECFKCKTQSLFVNKTSGFSLCLSCLNSGNWNISGDKISCQLSKNEIIKTGSIVWRELASRFSPLEVGQHSAVLDSCHIHDHHEVLNRLGAFIDEKSETVYVPLCTANSLPVGYKCITAKTEEAPVPLSSSGIVWFRPTPGLKKCVLVASVRDLLVLASAKSPYDIICLPNGVQSIPQEVLPLLEEYSKIILWLGDEPIAWDNARTFARKLGENRCYLVPGKGPTKALSGEISVEAEASQMLANAQPVSHAAITTFSALRQDVLDMLTNVDKVSGVKWQRFPELNELLRGHRRGELTVLTGPTGSGKTTFMSEFSVDLASQGVCTLWGSFEVRNSRLARTMLLQYSRKPELPHSFDYWADAFQLLPIYFMTFHGQQSLDTVMDAVRHATYVHDIGHVIIDNVQFMLGLSAPLSGGYNPFLDRFYRQDALIASFRSFATECNCHVTLVIHPRKERESEQLTASSIFGGAKASQEADNVLILQSKTVGNPPRSSKYIQVVKNRYSGDIGIVPLHFDKSILSFERKSKK